MNFKILFAIMFASTLLACQNNVEVEQHTSDNDTTTIDNDKDDFISQTGAKIEELGKKIKELDVKIEKTNDPDKKREYSVKRDSVNNELSGLQDNLEKAKNETKEGWKSFKENLNKGLDKVESEVDTLGKKIND